jgi:hypothetical protein
MKRFNVALIRLPHPKFTHLNAYTDIVSSLVYSLHELGFDCTCSENTINPSRINIVFGWEAAFRYREEILKNGRVENIFPDDTILFCLEQYGDLNIQEGHRLWRAAKTYQIWDFSQYNINAWQRVNPKFGVFHCKTGYSPVLEKIQRAQIEDLDASFMGRLDEHRFSVIKQAFPSDADTYIGINTFSNVWGAVRDQMIARSKVMLNICGERGAFEAVRVSYYLNNKRAVLGVLSENTYIDSYIKPLVLTCNKSDIRKYLDLLLGNESFRKEYANYCYSEFKKISFTENVYEFFRDKSQVQKI